jgi:L-ascorbate metabolism protein UlaG (beta-lactamase superfamily)
MQILFIYHSCFAVVTDTMVLVFDYWKDHPDGRLQHLLANRGDRQLFFVVSHFHEDHFNPDICNIEGARLLVSYDTAKRRHVKGDNVDAILRPDDTFSNDFFTLHALRSTDVGISSLLSLPDGTTIYHAGDNNNWYFSHDEDEHIRCSVDEMEGMFMSNLREVRNLTKRVDHVMFPVDPRLEGEMLRGACQWLQQIKTGHFYPMHTWEGWKEVNAGVEELRELFPEVHIGEKIYFRS